MKVFYDIHIHSILSACGDELMTPNNVLNMCMLKGLNLISITDHNTLKHLTTFNHLKSSYDFLMLYGAEITVKEGFHVLTYFKDMENALKFDKVIEDSINKNIIFDNQFNRQVICDEYDEEKEIINYQINQPISLDYISLSKLVRELDGIIILAHIDRPKDGILGFYSDLSGFDFDGIEIYQKEKKDELMRKYPILSKYKHLCNSDAHSLEMINDAVNYIDLTELSFDEFKKWLKC